MRLFLLSLMTALIAVQSPRSALAQSQVVVPLTYLKIEPAQLVETAFSTPYGRLLIAEFATVLAESADAACLQNNGIEKSGLEGRARAITLRQGTQFLRKFQAMIDQAALKAAFAARMGAGAEAELANLRNNPDLGHFLDLTALAQEAGTANAVIEMLDRNILVLRIKIARSFHPMATGNKKLLDADPSDAINDKLDDLATGGKSAALARYIELTDAAHEALNQSISANALLGVSDVDLMPGLDKDLADICVVANDGILKTDDSKSP